MTSVEQFCSERLRGTCRTDSTTRRKHSTDMSIYCMVPLAVVAPADQHDVTQIMQFCSENGVPLTPRAGASNTGGAAIGEGVILLPAPPAASDGGIRIVADALVCDRAEAAAAAHGPNGVDAGGNPNGDCLLVEVDAGVRHDSLQRFLLDRGFHLPSDPSSGPLSYIGANVATRASGAHALRHGAIDRYLHSITAVLADGTCIDTANAGTVPSSIRSGLAELAATLRADDGLSARIRAGQSMKSASGYNLAAVIAPDGPNLAGLFAGSVGTLGIISRVRLRCPRRPEGETLLVLAFDSEYAACAAVPAVRATDPAACEILNHFCTDLLRQQGISLADGAAAILVVEYAGAGHGPRAHEALHLLDLQSHAVAQQLLCDPEEQRRFWKLRKAMMLRLRNRTDGRKAYSVVNDIGVPVDALGAFLSTAHAIFASYDIPLPVYGHAADGNLHLRPLFDSADPRLVETVRLVTEKTYQAVLAAGGTITAEHGMGRLRAPFLRREWGQAAYDAMGRIKRLFDPADVLNREAMFYEGDVMRHFSA